MGQSNPLVTEKKFDTFELASKERASMIQKLGKKVADDWDFEKGSVRIKPSGDSFRLCFYPIVKKEETKKVEIEAAPDPKKNEKHGLRSKDRKRTPYKATRDGDKH